MSQESHHGRSPAELVHFALVAAGILTGVAGIIVNSVGVFITAGVLIVIGLGYFLLKQALAD
jgi:hypothetical protein